MSDLNSLYTSLSEDFNIGSFEEFSIKMQTPEQRKSFYEAMAAENINLGNYEEYENRLKPDFADDRGEDIKEEPSPAGTTVEGDGTVSTGEESSTVTPEVETLAPVKKELVDMTAEELVDVTEEEFEKWINDLDVPGASVTQDRIGDAVVVKIPGIPEEIEINLQPTPIGGFFGMGKEEGVNKIKLIKQQIEKIKTMPWLQDFESTRDINLLETWKGEDYNIEDETFNFIKESYGRATGLSFDVESTMSGKVYRVSRGDDQVFEGNAKQLQDFMVANPLTEEQQQSVRLDRRAITGYHKIDDDPTSETYGKKIFIPGTATDQSSLKTKIDSETTSEKIDQEFEQKQLAKLLINNSNITNPKQAKTLESILNYFLSSQRARKTPLKQGDDIAPHIDRFIETLKKQEEELGGNTSQLLESAKPQLVNAWNKLTENNSKILNDQKDIYAADKIKNLTLFNDEKNLKDKGIQNLYIANSFEEKNDILNAVETTKLHEADLFEQIEADKVELEKRQEEILATAKADGVYSIDYNESTGLYKVSARSEAVARLYENNLNAISRDAKSLMAVHKARLDKINLTKESQAKQLQDANTHNSFVEKSYSFGNIAIQTVESSFLDLIDTPAILFGSETAQAAKNARDESNAVLLQKAKTYDEAILAGEKLRFAGRSFLEQSGVITLAVGTAGIGSTLGLGVGGAQTLAAASIGITSAGQKRSEIENMEDAVDAAKLGLLELEQYKDRLPEEEYNKIKLELNKVIMDNDLTEAEKWGLIVSTGLIEGLVTRAFGTVPNASKAWRNFVNPTDDIMGLITRKNLQASYQGVKSFAGRTASEIAEEELIHFGTTGSEAMILGKEWDYSGWDDVLASSIIVAGGMNGPGIVYSTVMQQMVTADARADYYANKLEMDKIDEAIKTLDVTDVDYEDDRDALRARRKEYQDRVLEMNDEMELMAMSLGGKNLTEVIKYGIRLNSLAQQAGVDPTLSTEAQAKQIKAYVAKLELDGKTKQAKDFMKKWNTAIDGKQNAFNKKASFDNTIKNIYGKKGELILEDLKKKNPALKDASSKEQAIAVHAEYKRQRNARLIGDARNTPGMKQQVENIVYGEGGFANSKTKDGKKRKRRNIKLENDLYLKGANMIQARKADGLVLLKEEDVKAESILRDVKLNDLQLENAQTDDALQEQTMQAYDDIVKREYNQIGISDKYVFTNPDGTREVLSTKTAEEKEVARQRVRSKWDGITEDVINELREGTTNGVIVGGKYIVRDYNAAKAAIAEGNLLAGTVLSHEINHAIDAIAFDSDAALTNYSKNLMQYMNDNYSKVHDEALWTQEQIGNYDSTNPDNPFPKGEDLFFDEYSKSIGDILRRPSSRKIKNEIMALSQSRPNALRAIVRGDYAIETPRDAAVYLGSYLKGFENGKLGDLQKRKIRTKGTRRQVTTKKSANVSPILHEGANALGKQVNDLYVNRATNPDYAYDIANLFAPMLSKYLNRIEAEGAILGKQDEFGNVSIDERNQNIADYIANGMYGPRGIVELIGKFDPKEMVDVVDPVTGETKQEPNTMSRWLNGAFPQRLSEFTKNTTIDFAGFKVDIQKAANIITTESNRAIDTLLTPEVQNQLDTPYLNSLDLTEDQITALRAAVTTVVGGRLPALDSAVSKNQSITPLVSALKKEFGTKNGALHRVVQEIIGSDKAAVEAYLTNPENKKAILQTLTTTWLSKNLPKAVQKEINGIGYTTDFEGKKKGTKPGQVNFWRSSEEGPYKGMTDGKQKIRRNPNANKDVSNAMLLSNFAKGQTMTEIRRAGLEKLELALAQELGMEVFKADMINDGDLKNLFVGRQDLFDRILADNFVEEFVRQTERGITKRSLAVEFDLEYQVYELYKQAVKGFQKGIKLGGIEQILAGFSSPVINAFEEQGMFDLFDGQVESAFVKPIKKFNWPIGDKKSFVNNAANSDIAKEELAQTSEILIDTLDSGLLSILPDEVFGLQKRLLDPAARKVDKIASKKAGETVYQRNPDGSFVTGEYNYLKVKLDEARKKKSKENYDNLSGFEMLNSASGLMKSINTILNKDYSNLGEEAGRQKKIEEIQKKFGGRIDDANNTNHLVLKALNNEIAKIIAKKPELTVGVARLFQGATQNVKGFRSATTLDMMYVRAGSQAPFLTKDGKPTSTNTLEKGGTVNTNHPDYNEAYKETNGNTELIGDLLKYKGEHIDPSANVMSKLFQSTLDLAAIIRKNPASLKKGKKGEELLKQIVEEHQSKFDDILMNFAQSLGPVIDSKRQDDKLTSTSTQGFGRNLVIDDKLKYYVNTKDYSGVETLIKEKVFSSLKTTPLQQRLDRELISEAANKARTTKYSINPRGITVLDFDDTLATSKSQVISTSPDGVVRKLTAEEFAKEGADLLDQGWKHDFSEFSKVVDGKVASLFNKALKLQKKFGPGNMFVLTARPADSAQSIFEFLKANGLNIPLKNITGLANSTPEAKALWVADKVAEGYNDFYFADDALQNVQAVKNMLDQFDVKSKVQQARVKFSKGMSSQFNNILEGSTGISSEKQFSDAQARLRGQKTKYKSIIPASAQDFQGLLYNFLGKGKKGEEDMAFFKRALIDPFARAINELNAARQSSANDFDNLNKQFKDVKKRLNKKIEGSEYTIDQAIRVYLWDKAGFNVPGLSKRDLKFLTDTVNNDQQLKEYAKGVGLISRKKEGYSEPSDYWLAENIASDLLSDGAIGDARSKHLAEWIENKNVIFSKENLNKIEAIYGSNFKEALQDMLYRMETGRNRPTGGGRLMNTYMNWVNNSVGAIMFFNMRSALLQTISATNYINWSDNNPAKAAAAFANQPQYWKDFAMIFNSDFLKQRRSGNQRGINEAELSAAVAGAENKAKAAIAWLLKKGFLPTQLADSFAIASGGATFYRNRVKKYEKQGFTTEEAQEKAFLDFQEVTEVAQQSARPDMISQQQASPLGRLILSFQNTPMQYARIINKAARDLVNGRGDTKTHLSKIAYYGVVQSIIFGSLQSALFAALGQDEEEEYDKKKDRILNGMVDSLLSGIGYGGKAISTVKNTIKEYSKQKDKGWNADHTYTILQLLGFSPPIGSKLRKIYSSIQTEKFNEGVFKERGFTLDNPIWSAIGNVIEGITNVPLGRMSQKMLNIDNALDENNKWWERTALLLGWNTWDLGIRDPDIEAVKSKLKKEKKIKRDSLKKKTKTKTKEKKSQDQQVIVEENKKKSKKDGICSAISRKGVRCKRKAVKDGFCTIHEKAEQRKDGKKIQCRKLKSNGKRCKMKTASKSGYCYYHD